MHDKANLEVTMISFHHLPVEFDDSHPTDRRKGYADGIVVIVMANMSLRTK